MASAAQKKKNGPTIVKKYANRRLYDTGRSSYVTLDDLAEMIKENHDFVVQDAKTGKDITQSVLTQIIVEEESKGNNLLPVGFLKQLIGFYGDNLQALVPNYLEHTLQSFVKNQEQFRKQMNKSLEGMTEKMTGNMPLNPFSQLEEMNRQNIAQNMAMFENAMRAFTPFGPSSFANEKEKEEKIQHIKNNIKELEKELSKLSS